MDVAKSEMFENMTIVIKAFLSLIKLNKTAVQTVSKIRFPLHIICVYERFENIERVD